MIRRLILFFGGCLVSWLVAAYPVFAYWEAEGLWHSLLALTLCVVPGLLTLGVGLWVAGQANRSDWIFLAAFGGTTVRMFVVLGTVVLLGFTWSQARAMSFLATLAIFYIVSLALEMSILLTALPLSSQRKSDCV